MRCRIVGMTPKPPDGFEWPEWWEPISAEDTWFGYPPRLPESEMAKLPYTGSLVEELKREVCSLHSLYGAICWPVGKHTRVPVEFLFVTNKPDMPLVWVHLTMEEEHSSDYPRTIGYLTWDAFKAAWS